MGEPSLCSAARQTSARRDVTGRETLIFRASAVARSVRSHPGMALAVGPSTLGPATRALPVRVRAADLGVHPIALGLVTGQLAVLLWMAVLVTQAPFAIAVNAIEGRDNQRLAGRHGAESQQSAAAAGGIERGHDRLGDSHAIALIDQAVWCLGPAEDGAEKGQRL